MAGRSGRLGVRVSVVILSLLSPALVGPRGFAGDQGGEIGLQLGALAPDRDLSGEPMQLDNVKPFFGIRGDYLFSPHWGFLVDAGMSMFGTETPGGDLTQYTARTGLELLHRPHWTDYQTFLAFGGGWTAGDLDSGVDFSRWFGSLSAGQRFSVGANQLLRWELRVDHTLTDDGLSGEDLTTPYLLMAYTWGMPSRARDADADGVMDRQDDCPGTPSGAQVDERGCPLDGDGDGVPDGIDRCPDTPAGFPVDGEGCPLDGDRDGVPDGDDKCPGTAPEVKVDARGCPADSDGDGVLDPSDRCPDTPRGAKVDLDGCPVDSDGDGVLDGKDECPDTPRFAHVDARGCPSDGDGDGVFDGIDRCPQTPAGSAVDEVGCPAAKPLFEEQRRTLVLDGVNFAHASAELDPRSRGTLDQVAASLLAWPEVRVEVGGHTDSTGNDSYNLALSRRRAEAVRDYLVGRGVPATRLTARGYGETEPIASNADKDGRGRNRRVELKRLE